MDHVTLTTLHLQYIQKLNFFFLNKYRWNILCKKKEVAHNQLMILYHLKSYTPNHNTPLL